MKKIISANYLLLTLLTLTACSSREMEKGCSEFSIIFIFIIIPIICIIKFGHWILTKDFNDDQTRDVQSDKTKTTISTPNSTDLLMSRVSELLKEKEALQARIKELKKELAEFDRTCEDYELQRVRRTNRELKDKIRDLTTELEEAEKENEALQDEIDELKDRLEDDSDQKNAYNDKLKIQEAIIEGLQKEIESLRSQLGTNTQESKTIIQQEDNSHREENLKLKRIISFLERENDQLKGQLSMKVALDSRHDETLEEMRELRAELADAQEQLDKYTAHGDFRKRYPAHYRTHDGHWVRSKIEREIANFLYDHKIRYEFEREYAVPNTKITYYPDFYLPDHRLFIEYFGKEDPEYVEKRETKKQHYARDSRYRFEYVSFDDDYLLEEHLKEILRRHGIIY